MKPFIKEMSESFAETIYEILHSRGITNIPGEGNFCPSCQKKMSCRALVIGYYTKPDARLWVCSDCSQALAAEKRIKFVNDVRSLPFAQKVALVFNGKIPQAWLDEWHKHCKRFPEK